MLKLALFQLIALVLTFLVVISESFGILPQPISTCPADKNEPWTYRGKNGPQYWGNTYPACNGRSQSPIEINSGSAVKDENLAKLVFNNYNVPISRATIENNGHTIEVVPNDDVQRTISVNGDMYSLQQFHFHWGNVNFRGSEHVLNGVRFAMEMHLVHRNQNDNLAVVGIFFQEQGNANNDLQPIVDELVHLKYKDTEAVLNSDVNLNNLLPANRTSFYRYNGSLTTPGCSEGVTWSVVPNPLTVGSSQMVEFRKLYSAKKEDATAGCRLAGNYRPVQGLNDRQVYLSQ